MSGNIVDVAVKARNLTKLVLALKVAGLVDALKTGSLTVLAPVDQAFERLDRAALNALLDDPAKLGTVLKYHVIPGKLFAADVAKLDGQEVQTLAGLPLTVRVKPDGVYFETPNGSLAKVIQADIPARNGVIHLIDTVLLPPSNASRYSRTYSSRSSESRRSPARGRSPARDRSPNRAKSPARRGAAAMRQRDPMTGRFV